MIRPSRAGPGSDMLGQWRGYEPATAPTRLDCRGFAGWAGILAFSLR